MWWIIENPLVSSLFHSAFGNLRCNFFFTVINEETPITLSTVDYHSHLWAINIIRSPSFHFSEKGSEISYSIMENVICNVFLLVIMYLFFLLCWDVNAVYELMNLGCIIISIFYISIVWWKLPCNAFQYLFLWYYYWLLFLSSSIFFWFR